MSNVTRRDFLKNGSLGAASFLTVGMAAVSTPAFGAVDPNSKPAILGGNGVVCDKGPVWPVLTGNESARLAEVLQSGIWCRAGEPECLTSEFEKTYAELLGAKHCIAVNSGTSSLIASLAALEVGPGDEVITTPYTYIATVNCIIQHYGLPVLADVDLETFQVCPKATEKVVGPNTKAVIPVHIGGAPAKMDSFLDLAARHGNLPIVEDACQAHFGKWIDRYLGTLGTTGCFSMQVTKNLSCGDGGAVLTNDDALADRLYKIHSNGHSPLTAPYDFRYEPLHAANYRMTGFQAAILLAQMKHTAEFARIRNENALYLSSLLSEIPGVYPVKIYDGGTSAWHLYMFRVVEEEFGCSRDQFYKALDTDGIPTYTGYTDGDWINYIKTIYSTPAARRVYSEKALRDWAEKIDLPNHNRLCRQAIWFQQTQLLAPRQNMEVIADAVRRIQKHAGEIAAQG